MSALELGIALTYLAQAAGIAAFVYGLVLLARVGSRR